MVKNICSSHPPPSRKGKYDRKGKGKGKYLNQTVSKNKGSELYP